MLLENFNLTYRASMQSSSVIYLVLAVWSSKTHMYVPHNLKNPETVLQHRNCEANHENEQMYCTILRLHKHNLRI